MGQEHLFCAPGVERRSAPYAAVSQVPRKLFYNSGYCFLIMTRCAAAPSSYHPRQGLHRTTLAKCHVLTLLTGALSGASAAAASARPALCAAVRSVRSVRSVRELRRRATRGERQRV